MQVAVDGSCPILATVAEVLMQQRPYMLIRGVGDVEGGGGGKGVGHETALYKVQLNLKTLLQWLTSPLRHPSDSNESIVFVQRYCCVVVLLI